MPTPSPLSLTPYQQTLVEMPLEAHVFLEGPAGCGKTTTGVERLLYLMAQGVPGSSILLLVPQRNLAEPYTQALANPGVVAGGMVTVQTLGGLARRLLELFWPLVAGPAGFAHPGEAPIFLNLEAAQYFMARLVQPQLQAGSFDTIALDRSRLYSQLLDNLNKAAVMGFPYTEIGARLSSAWGGDPARLRVYEDVQTCATAFRGYCLAHNLLDFSLLVEVFRQHAWPLPACQDYLRRTYQHLLVDNLEEDVPVTHDLLGAWLPDFVSALLIYDQEAGYRYFLGADPLSAYRLKDACDESALFDQSFVTAPAVRSLAAGLQASLPRPPDPTRPRSTRPPARRKVAPGDPHPALEFSAHRFYPQMLDWTAEKVATLVHDEGLPPVEIVILAPILSDALRFALASRLEARGLPVRSQRPSRPLHAEPATQCLLTLAALAHPEWGLQPTRFDLAYALVQAIAGLDLVRAQLLVEIVYRTQQGRPSLSSFDRLQPEAQARLTVSLGRRYEDLRAWLDAAQRRSGDELDYFFRRLFGEVLSQPGYGFHEDYNASQTAANLVDSARNFRQTAGRTLAEEGRPLGLEYLNMVSEGVIAAQYLRSWQAPQDESVLLLPAHTFLISNRPATAQFWLGVGSHAWSERLYQPLTHPYVLSRNWPRQQTWTDVQEVEKSQEMLYRLVMGLLRRCRQTVYLGLSELNEQGYEERGPLLKAFQRVLQDLAAGGGG
jgi:hypothetical protein